MLARTVSGVFDKLKSLPNLPQEVMSGIRGRDSLVERKESTSQETDTDSITVDTDFAQDMVRFCCWCCCFMLLLLLLFFAWFSCK